MSRVTIYGIKNCDSMRKAMRWLDAHNISYQFHDYRKDGLSQAMLKRWADELGWEALLNRRGTTWRKLPEAQREQINQTRAIALMATQPALIKRPLLDVAGQKLLGFAEADYKKLLS